MKAPVGSRSPSSRLWKVSALAVSVQSASPPSSAVAPASSIRTAPSSSMTNLTDPSIPAPPSFAFRALTARSDDLAHVISPRCGREALDFW